MQRDQQQPTCEIVCDRIIYQRLQNIQENQIVLLTLFHCRNQSAKLLFLPILDMKRSKQSQANTQFNRQQCLRLFHQIYSGTKVPSVLTLTFNKQAILQLSSSENKDIKITQIDNAKEINQLFSKCAIISLRLPDKFYSNEDIIYDLEGFKFNPIGKIREQWNIVSKGKVTKAMFEKNDQKVVSLLKQNSTYSKTQLKQILQTVQEVITLPSQIQSKSKVIEELKVLGQNYYHSDKFISNCTNVIMPILNFQIQLMCSFIRGENSKNFVGTQKIIQKRPVLHYVCVNFDEGLDYCQKSIKRLLESIFTKKQEQQKSLLSLSNTFYLSTMPTKIVNPHYFLKTQFKDKFSQYYVKGLYEYYHYGDHNFNDQGWGCAYRSLQTLLSWFRLQQKLNLLCIPTVSEIQNLIDMIDFTSQTKLSNTNNWIGATEVSWVVKKLTNFDCRILHIKDGKDIVEHAQMFRDHLQNYGTPIMYGGDEYAYTIVGINYNWKLGEIMFLILDPHYNGGDRVDKIIEKKGICWRKPQEMFKKGVFYNFCMPILR